MFLQGVGGFLLPIPFLSSLAPKEVLAQAVKPNRYFISLICNFDIGQISNWVPSIESPGLTYQGDEAHQFHYAPLSSYINSSSDHLSPIFRDSLNSYLNDMNILNGLDSPIYAGHNMSQVLGNPIGQMSNSPLTSNVYNLYGNETIDQLIARDPDLNPNGGPPMILGTVGGSTQGPCSFVRDFNGSLVGKTPVGYNPQNIYDSMFFYGNLAESGSSGNSARSGLLGAVIEDFRRIRNSRAIASLDRQILDDIADLYADLDRSMNASSTPNCSHSSLDTSNDGPNLDGNLTHQNFTRMILAALQCDTTRSVVYQVRLTPDDFGGSYHQQVSHTPYDTHGGVYGMDRIANEYHKFISGTVRPLLDLLSATTDPSNGESYLNNSVVLVSTENSVVHSHDSIPTLLIGGLNGKMQTGNYIDYRDLTKDPFSNVDPNDPTFNHLYPGMMHNRLLVTLAEKFEMTNYENSSGMAHLLNVTDGSYGVQNNGITSIGGYGVVAPPINTFSGSWGRSRYTSKLSNYDLSRSGFALPLI